MPDVAANSNSQDLVDAADLQVATEEDGLQAVTNCLPDGYVMRREAMPFKVIPAPETQARRLGRQISTSNSR